MAMEMSEDRHSLAIPHLDFLYKVFHDLLQGKGDVKMTYGP